MAGLSKRKEGSSAAGQWRGDLAMVVRTARGFFGFVKYAIKVTKEAYSPVWPVVKHEVSSSWKVSGGRNESGLRYPLRITRPRFHRRINLDEQELFKSIIKLFPFFFLSFSISRLIYMKRTKRKRPLVCNKKGNFLIQRYRERGNFKSIFFFFFLLGFMQYYS